MHGFGFEDIADLQVDGQTTTVWVREDENSAAIALKANDADFTDGAIVLTPGAGADDAVGFATAAQPFQCTVGKPWWIETSIKIADIDDCELFFGLTEDPYDTGVNYGTVAAGAGPDTDKCGFKKATHNSGLIQCVSSLNAAEDTATAVTITANNDVVTLAAHWDGISKVKFYAGFAATGTEVGALSEVHTTTTFSDEKMGIVLQQVHTTAAADDALTVNYVRGAWTV
tara:strand:+ start:436 stop:1119 length:684 start_codon:yes stop_codon:yes gene_type:complete